ncbi:hypothetical protein FA13DRAFT_1716195 [Coprinellus micaceus]|uniref:Uncharacterized protein n=1 Tax=Coprinellus micaceus TaxID=71717 RepID=A0A4Y7SK53_COPMI|nr:hypothetical protein FA13DRAFT_1716195 [Coprinellus micaceus]
MPQFSRPNALATAVEFFCLDDFAAPVCPFQFRRLSLAFDTQVPVFPVDNTALSSLRSPTVLSDQARPVTLSPQEVMSPDYEQSVASLGEPKSRAKGLCKVLPRGSEQEVAVGGETAVAAEAEADRLVASGPSTEKDLWEIEAVLELLKEGGCEGDATPPINSPASYCQCSICKRSEATDAIITDSHSDDEQQGGGVGDGSARVNNSGSKGDSSDRNGENGGGFAGIEHIVNSTAEKGGPARVTGRLIDLWKTLSVGVSVGVNVGSRRMFLSTRVLPPPNPVYYGLKRKANGDVEERDSKRAKLQMG